MLVGIVVGYANTSLVNSQWKSVCSQFIKIGSTDGSDMVLGDLVAGNGWNPTNGDKIKVIDENTAVGFEATYYTWDTLPPKMKTKYPKETFVSGWYKLNSGTPDLDKGLKNSEPLPYGSCVLVMSSVTGASVTSNGEVVAPEDGKITFSLTNSKWMYVGNCTPINRTLGDFEAGNGWNPTNGDKIKVIDENTAVAYEATYYTWDTLPPKMKTKYPKETFVSGWYKLNSGTPDLDKGLKNSEPIPAGSGFLVMSSVTGATITLPSAL